MFALLFLILLMIAPSVPEALWIIQNALPHVLLRETVQITHTEHLAMCMLGALAIVVTPGKERAAKLVLRLLTRKLTALHALTDTTDILTAPVSVLIPTA